MIEIVKLGENIITNKKNQETWKRITKHQKTLESETPLHAICDKSMKYQYTENRDRGRFKSTCHYCTRSSTVHQIPQGKIHEDQKGLHMLALQEHG